MATISLLEKARQRRLNALATLGSAKRSRYESNLVSIFDTAFDESGEEPMLVARNNVIAFRSSRPHVAAANEIEAPTRIAA